jgi:hypothetical protein
MAKSFMDIMNTVPIDMTDPDEVTIRNPFGPSNSRGKGSSMVDLTDPDAVTLRNPFRKKAKPEDMSKRITEKSNAGPNVKPSKPKSSGYKMPKSTTPDMDTTQGTRGSRVSFEAGETKETPKETVKEVIKETSKSAPIEERSTPAEERRAAREESRFSSSNPMGMKKGGSVSSASRRADGCAIRGKTRA